MDKYTPVERVSHQSFFEYLDSKLQPIFAKQPSVNLLEVGCGSGILAFIIQDKYKEKLVYTGIDPSKEAIDKAKARGVTGVQAIGLEDISSDNTYDVVICTKSFHHLPSLPDALAKIHQVLKPGGLFLADEFAREDMDDVTAKFLFGRMDELEAAGKFYAPAKWAPSNVLKHEYLKRWQVKFMPEQLGGTGEAFLLGPYPPAHGAHAGRKQVHEHEHSHAHGTHEHEHSHAHGTHEHEHSHAHGAHDHEHSHAHGAHDHEHSHSHDAHEHSHAHGAHAHGAQEAQGAHDHGHGHGHGHHHSLPTSVEMTTEIKKVFPNLVVIRCSYLYLFMSMRFDGSTAGEDIVSTFKSEEEDAIAKKQIVPIGLRFSCSKL